MREDDDGYLRHWTELPDDYLRLRSQDWFQGENDREPTGDELGIIDEIVKEGNNALGV